jgi:hypothetical protein
MCIFILLRTAQYRGGIFSPFMQMYLNMRSFHLSPAHIYSVSFSPMYRIRNADHWLLLVRRKLPQTHWLMVITKATRYRNREKSSGQTQYWNNRSQGPNLGSTPGRADPLAQYFFTNLTTVHYRYMLGNAMIMSFMTSIQGRMLRTYKANKKTLKK